ncbi:hypothetical protein LTR49_012830 [Elasticomyces elasticus]|nr:hypothetical protein LTR49_012830 [Elasticomyces elasticus]KAK5763150.1 hypothetical protein LTS12_006739 [Elasticomyces elasticus]
MASTEAASVPTGSLDQVAQDASKNPCLLDIAIAVITIVGCLMLYLLTITLVAALTALTVEIITRIIKRLGSEACDSPTRSPKKCWSWQACPEALIVLCVFSGIFCFFALMMSNVEEFFLDESSQLVRVLAVIFGFLVFDTVCILMVAIGVAIVASFTLRSAFPLLHSNYNTFITTFIMATSTTSTPQSMATDIAANMTNSTSSTTDPTESPLSLLGMAVVGLAALLKFFGFLVSLGVLFGLFSGLSFVTTAIIMQLNHRCLQLGDTMEQGLTRREHWEAAMGLGAFSGVIALLLTIAIGVSVGPADPSLWELEMIILAGSAAVALIHLACVVAMAVGSVVVWTYRRFSGKQYSEIDGQKLEQGVKTALVDAEK